MFCYDYFFVFKVNVMVIVASGFESPLKLMFPKSASFDEFYQIGLGDLIIPSVLLSLAIRIDYIRAY